MVGLLALRAAGEHSHGERRVKRIVVSAAVVSCVVLSVAAPASASTPAWRVQFTPKPPDTSTFLLGVSCPARGDCTAVGFAVSGGNPSTLAEHWDGTRWTIQTTPNPVEPPPRQASLGGVSCASSASCTAVGDFYTTSGYQPLGEQWDGTSWTIQTVPIPAGAQGGDLGSVSCASPANCTAVGYYVMTGGENLPLAEHWNGTSWAVQAVPVSSGGGELLGVSCPTDLDCIAVGESSGQTGVLAERWTGSRWIAQRMPRPAGTNMELASVSCKGLEHCIAVGDETTRSGSGTTTTGAIVERSIGATWTIQADATPAGTALSGVSCASAMSCTAVGEDGLDAGPPPIPTYSVAEHWNGTSWALQTVPEPARTYGAALSGVWCLGTLDCTAVGDFGTGRPRANPLANHYG
jgi:hypothetical protein